MSCESSSTEEDLVLLIGFTASVLVFLSSSIDDDRSVRLTRLRFMRIHTNEIPRTNKMMTTRPTTTGMITVLKGNSPGLASTICGFDLSLFNVFSVVKVFVASEGIRDARATSGGEGVIE